MRAALLGPERPEGEFRNILKSNNIRLHNSCDFKELDKKLPSFVSVAVPIGVP